jgi:hypothetical protein
MGLMVGLWFAIAPVLLTIVLVYYSLFKILRLLYREHFVWFVASIIFLSPFGFVLSQSRDLLELTWVLLLTPFYGVLVLLLSTIWIARFYCLAFAVLSIAQFLLQRGKVVNESKRGGNFEAFLAQHLKGYTYFAARGETMVNRIVRRGGIFAKNLWKCWSFVLSVVLLVTLASSFASGVSLRNPTYLEAQQFISSDKTDSHPYIEGSYTCANFAGDFRRNALVAGYECGYVFVYFPDARSHVLNCFNTTDEGLVFVEPQWDKFVNVTVGKSYFNGNLASLVFNDTVLWYYVEWQASSVIP